MIYCDKIESKACFLLDYSCLLAVGDFVQA